MIKFFRHIRQNLIMQNKTPKPALPAGRYFKYAIGEIILVVIGILIALQINNWNEQRKIKLNANNYVNKIINDLTVDTLNINELIKKSDLSDANITNYFNYFNTVDSLSIPIEKIIDSVKGIDVKYMQYYPVNQSFKDMESSGSSNLLKDSHRDFLIKLNAQQEELVTIINSQLDIAINEINISEQLLGEPSDFYTKLKQQNTVERKTQSLLHRHLHLAALKDLYYYIEIRGEKIKKLSHEAILLLTQTNKN